MHDSPGGRHECPCCGARFSSQEAHCEDWRLPARAFGCPSCGAFLRQRPYRPFRPITLVALAVATVASVAIAFTFVPAHWPRWSAQLLSSLLCSMSASLLYLSMHRPLGSRLMTVDDIDAARGAAPSPAPDQAPTQASQPGTHCRHG